MSVSSEGASEAPAAGHPSGRLFAHAEFDAHPARSCHSLIRRLPAGTDAVTVRANLDALAERHPVLRDMQLFDEALDVDAENTVAHRRRTREADRAVNGSPVIVRAVVLGYADGAADLVLVAHRRAVDRRALDQLATALADPAQTVTLPEPVAGASLQGGPPELPWGLGDPARTGRTGTVELTATAVAGGAAPAVLVAAAAVVLARYGQTERSGFTLITGGLTATDTQRSVTLPVGDATRVTDLLDASAHAGAAGGEPLSGMSAVGVLLTEGRTGDVYRPVLAPVFPVTLAWQHAADGTVSGALHYDEGVLDPEIAAQFAGHIDRLVEALAQAPADARVGDIELMDTGEAAAIIVAGHTPAWGDTVVAPIHELFRKVVAAQPDAPALSDPDRTLTFGELDARSDAVAAALRGYGVAPADRVGVCLDRDADLVITLLGVLKAGATYVPMDVAYPAERLVHMVTDAGARLVLSSRADFPVVDGVTVTQPSELSGADGEPIVDLNISADDVAYVIYTSGSTGRPKGVAVPHRNVGALLAATSADFGLGPADTWTLFHSSAFDFSVWEIWGALLTGGHLVVVPYFVSRVPEDFHDLLVRHRVTVLNQTPSAFATLKEVDAERSADLALRLVIFGGEPLDVRTLQEWFRRHPHTRCRMVNMFGITETTVHVTSQTVTPQDVRARSRSVGRALPGWSVSVRDAEGRVQPFGVPGEIYVGGAGLASHYLNQEELTNARFVSDPVTGERVYRSGDLGRLRPDGRLDHLGRIDGQVKMRGFRIELDEIRSVLLEDRNVAAAAVILNGHGGDAADVCLEAYLVPRHDDVSVEDIRQRAARFLPDYMVPATFTLFSELPLTVNGKVDVSRLKPITPAAEDGQPTDDPVLRVWREVLGKHIGPDDDFFVCGGTSLLAVRLSGALRKAGLPPISLRELYVYPTAAELSALLTGRELVEESNGRT